MADDLAKPDPPREPARLEQMHHEICTALTILRTNIALARLEIVRVRETATRRKVRTHLFELDGAVDRLQALARDIRRWHQAMPTGRSDTRGPLRGYFPGHADV